uniref:Uncharacterized protein n=1 Tax=Glossina palpalis gambiensis TaxID=67801 RepID=A0A1B0ASJ0_9MUSC
MRGRIPIKVETLHVVNEVRKSIFIRELEVAKQSEKRNPNECMLCQYNHQARHHDNIISTYYSYQPCVVSWPRLYTNDRRNRTIFAKEGEPSGEKMYEADRTLDVELNKSRVCGIKYILIWELTISNF